MMELCRICGGRNYIFLHRGMDRFYHLDGEFEAYECEGCGLAILHPPVPNEELAKYYPETYYSYNEGAETPAAPKEGKAAYYLKHPFHALNALVYSKILRQNADIDSEQGWNVLDIGCGDGKYLAGQMKKGVGLWGIDISESAVKRLKKRHPSIKTFCGNAWDAGFPADHFDLIRLTHVLEHVNETDLLLEEVRRLLKPGGIAIIQVPNTRSATRRLFGRFWVHWDTPRHVVSFSKTNLRRLLTERGFEIDSFRTMENSFSFLASSLYALDHAKKRKRRLQDLKSIWDDEMLKASLALYCLAVNLTGFGDTMEFRLKKGNR